MEATVSWGPPALIINGEVKAVGSVPLKNKLKEWLVEAEKAAIV